MAGSYAQKAATPSKPSSGVRKSSANKNASILNFFQKTDTPPGATSRQSRMTQFVTSSRSPRGGQRTPTFQRSYSQRSDTAGGLFLEDRKDQREPTFASTGQARSRTPEDIWGDDDGFLEPDDNRDKDQVSSTKRRKVGSSTENEKPENDKPDNTLKPIKPTAPARPATSGPFIDESDSEEDTNAYQELQEISTAPRFMDNRPQPLVNDEPAVLSAEFAQPPLVRDATSYTDDEPANFDDIEEDELVGEEFRERPWGSERQEFVADCEMNVVNEINDPPDADTTADEGVSACPICQKALAGLDTAEISIHVNDCLDGKSTSTISPLLVSTPSEPLSQQKPKPTLPNPGLTRTERAAVARPGQRDPYFQNATGARSVFSKMMAGNAEDTAWATAAANETSSRGKQAYQRTCPFYKIIPGFSICVDAFRYGAVEGCNAYFLSHFHSDHYIGLTKSWSHGPIYCSRATANLVRQQLRVDPKWLVDLDFETTSEVPDTGGVQVTMIPANHCPGSSLFLFEKDFGRGSHTRRRRVLHCGDFRASSAHVQHPLLRPDPITPVTGQPRQQRIDECYLDTTYLNPKYAFPSQDDVITACAELCVRLNDQAGVGTDVGNPCPGGLMSKFLSSVTVKDSTKPQHSPTRGRLLVVIGTYSIGKERICLGIARALGTKIFATPQKQRICACLEDRELSALLTHDPREAQVHMQTLFEIRADTLADYLYSLKPHFSRVVGFRPTGWSYRPPAGRMLENPPVAMVLRGQHWKTPFTAADLTPQRGSTRESACFGVPYSEHSSFRELTMFCCALRIGRVIPTVNVGSQKSRDQMKAWMDRWEGEKQRHGLFPAHEW